MTTPTMKMKTKIETRLCRICNEEKALELMEVDKRYKTGYSNRCKACKFESNSKASKAYRRLYERQDKYPIPVEVTRKGFEQLYGLWKSVCIYCLKHMEEEGETPSFDHIVPLSNPDSRNHISNIHPVCNSCNARKGNKPLYVFYDETPGFPNRSLEYLVEYVARLSDRTIEEVDAEFERHWEEYMNKKKERAS